MMKLIDAIVSRYVVVTLNASKKNRFTGPKSNPAPVSIALVRCVDLYAFSYFRNFSLMHSEYLTLTTYVPKTYPQADTLNPIAPPRSCVDVRLKCLWLNRFLQQVSQ
jgi:hypothetical protein